MSLVLSIRKGEDFFVGDDRFIMTARDANNNVVLHNDTLGDVFINPDFSVEVQPDVKLTVSLAVEDNVTRVMVTAPRKIAVMLGRRYREMGINAGAVAGRV